MAASYDEYIQRLKNSITSNDRIDIATDPECPPQLLAIFVEQDTESDVILAAACNPACPTSVLEIAATRTNTRLSMLLRLRQVQINEIIDKSGAVSADRDAYIVSHILSRDNKHEEIHLGNYEIKESDQLKVIDNNVNAYKEHIVLILCPAWGIVFPPYNLARLSATLRNDGYKVTVIDMNIHSYHLLKEKTGMDFWSSEKYHLWFSTNFSEKILPHLSEYINNIVEQVVDLKPDVIGFSIYNTNIWCTSVALNLLRGLLPSTPIVVGGPEAAQDTTLSMFRTNAINYIFKGEAESTFLEFLNKKEYSSKVDKQIIGTLTSKINLDTFPFPDYSDYNLKQYMHPDGVSTETSRGCVAQCSFCSETWFWKFRSRDAENIVKEIEYQIEQTGASRFWFVDSLVNGDLKSFRKLVNLIVDKGIRIRWNGYARHDGRMDRDFIFKIAESGCTSLSFGTESGSQKVLNDMKKKIDIWEVESNLKDCFDAGMDTHVNWMVGFPTETNLDFLHSMILLWNSGRYISAISPGMGCGPAAFSDLEKNGKVYGMDWTEKNRDNTFLNTWYTTDYKNTALHRVVRLKLLATFLNILKTRFNIGPHNGQQYDDVILFYKLMYNDKGVPNTYINQPKNLDLNIFNSNEHSDIAIDLSNSIGNEYLGIAWLLYNMTHTEFSLTITFDPVVDFKNFGAYIAVNYTASVSISVNNTGDFTISVHHKLDHDSLFKEAKFVFEKEKERGVDMSFNTLLISHGNFNNLLRDTDFNFDSIHSQYNKKTIPILPIEN